MSRIEFKDPEKMPYKYPVVLYNTDVDIVALCTDKASGVVIHASHGSDYKEGDLLSKIECNFSSRSWIPFSGSIIWENGK